MHRGRPPRTRRRRAVHRELHTGRRTPGPRRRSRPPRFGVGHAPARTATQACASRATCGSPSRLRQTVRDARGCASTWSATAGADGPAVYPSAGLERGQRDVGHQAAAAGPAVARLGRRSPPGAWIELDVTPLVKGDGSSSSCSRSPAATGAIFYSRQSVHPPQRWTSRAAIRRDGARATSHARPGAAVTAAACRHARTADLPATSRGRRRADARRRAVRGRLLRSTPARGAFDETGAA